MAEDITIKIDPKKRDDALNRNLREALTCEDALGIGTNSSRHRHIMWLLDEIMTSNKTKAEAMMAIAKTTDLTDVEQVYLGFMLCQRNFILKVPFGNFLVSKV